MNLMTAHLLDRFSPEVLFLFSVFLMVLFMEIGFRIGRANLHNSAKAQHSQVRAIMGAGLGLTAFMLAFTFAMAQSHYDARVQGMLEEVRLLNDAFMQAELKPEPYRTEVRERLRTYAQGRIDMDQAAERGDLDEVFRLVREAEDLQEELWRIGVAYAREGSEAAELARSRGPFLQAIIGLMDIQTVRLEAAVANRIPSVIWFTLYLTGALSMLITGYQGALVGRRSPIATVTLAVAFAAVMMLITDLDRPIMRFFDIDNRVVYELAERMDRAMAAEDL